MTVADKAKKIGLTHSKYLLYLIIRTKHEDVGIIASNYFFDKPLNVFELAEKFSQGDHDTDLITLTITEGESVKQIAKKAAQNLDNFSADEFLFLATEAEGKLFPETYYLPKNYSEAKLFELLTDTFDKKIISLETKIASSTLTLDEIVILASIIEREADSEESMKMVSGILQNRLRIGMPLQVDASMEYILEKPLSELTSADLKTESPYNTYLNTGLPPTPIGNPGETSLRAILEPTNSDFLFYITDNSGNFHYAKTFDEHRQNISRYLR